MIDGKLYVDGGLKANLPSDIAQSMGNDIVVAVLVDTAIAAVPNEKFKSKKALILRVMNIMMASSDKMQTLSSDTLIYPDVDFIPAFTKDPEILRRGIAAGQTAADSVAARIISELVALRRKGTDQANSTSGEAISK
jgi:NTE family protein